MSSKKILELVQNDLTDFISNKYPNGMPNSLLVAQEFILKYPDHGRNYGLSEINRMIEEGIKQGLFS
ncbi:MAG: hypothetical protein ACPK85_13865 [Methanosarcina sp.]